MKTHKLTSIGLFTSILCILGPIAIILPFSPVPVSLGTLGILLACLLLGAKDGLLCTILYLLLGFAGLPVFTGFSGGAGKLFSPTGGYLLGYPFLALISGTLAAHWRHNRFLQFLGLLIGILFCYFFGTLWLTYQTGISFESALWAGAIPYIPFDVVKIAVSLFFDNALRKRIKYF